MKNKNVIRKKKIKEKENTKKEKKSIEFIVCIFLHRITKIIFF